jgi:hypothetical protein
MNKSSHSLCLWSWHDVLKATRSRSSSYVRKDICTLPLLPAFFFIMTRSDARKRVALGARDGAAAGCSLPTGEIMLGYEQGIFITQVWECASVWPV